MPRCTGRGAGTRSGWRAKGWVPGGRAKRSGVPSYASNLQTRLVRVALGLGLGLGFRLGFGLRFGLRLGFGLGFGLGFRLGFGLRLRLWFGLWLWLGLQTRQGHRGSEVPGIPSTRARHARGRPAMRRPQRTELHLHRRRPLCRWAVLCPLQLMHRPRRVATRADCWSWAAVASGRRRSGR